MSQCGRARKLLRTSRTLGPSTLSAALPSQGKAEQCSAGVCARAVCVALCS